MKESKQLKKMAKNAAKRAKADPVRAEDHIALAEAFRIQAHILKSQKSKKLKR